MNEPRENHVPWLAVAGKAFGTAKRLELGAATPARRRPTARGSQNVDEVGQIIQG